jgi:hypothetical protein
MSNDTAKTITTNIVPVQGTFEPLPPYECIDLIGPAGTPFFAPTNPDLDGVAITNSTINSSVIGGTTPAAGTFTNVATTTGTITSPPSGPTSIVNQAYVDAVAQGLAFKQPANYTTTGNITLSGLTTQVGGDWPSTLTAGERILVKDQTTQSENGIYVADSGAWTRSNDANTWDELISAYLFVTSGTLLSGSAWVNTNQQGGTLGVTAVTFVQFSNNALYTAGTGLTLSGFQFLITNTGVSAATYGSGSTVPAIAVNAQGQITSATNTSIAIAGSQITSGTIDSARLSGSYSGITGVGTLTDLTVSNVISGSISGNAATATTAGSATTATTATNLAGGATGSIPYQSGAGATTFLAAGTNGQVLTLAGGVPTYATPTTGTVTSVSGTGTVSGISLSGTVTSSGSLTLGGTLDLSAPPTIGNTTPNTGRFTNLTVDDNTTLGTSNTDDVIFNARIASEITPQTDNAYDLGSSGREWRDLFIDGTANIDSLVADTADINAGTIDNTVIGATTPVAGTFTDLRFNGTLSAAGSTGTNGFVLTSNGASAPTWEANANGLAIVDDTTTNATRYLTFTSATTGNITTANVSSTKLAFNPSTGSLGIGTTNPSAKLQSTVNSATQINNIIENSVSYLNYGVFGTGENYIYSGSAHPLLIGTNNTERMRITSTGDVGIGTSSPGEKLEVNGNIRMSAVPGTNTNAALPVLFQTAAGTIDGGSSLTFNPGGDVLSVNGFAITSSTVSGAGSLATFTCANGAGQYDFRAADDSLRFIAGSSEAMRINSSGNVGIGTSSPSSKLDVFNATATEVISRSSTTSSYANFIVDVNNGTSQRMQMVSFGSTASDNLLGIARANNSFLAKSGGLLAVGTRDSNALVLSTDETERMRITASGNLEMASSAGIVQTATNQTIRMPSTGGIGYVGNINSATVFQIAYDSTSAGVQLSSGATSWGTFSDSRLKNITGTYTNALADISQLQPVKFTWKADEDNKPQVGVIAQSITAVVPEAVESSTIEMEGTEEYLTVRYTELIPLMIASIQELKATVDAQAARIAALESN